MLSHLLGIVHLENAAPVIGMNAGIEHHRDVHVDHHQVTRGHFRLMARARENLLDDRHAHGTGLLRLPAASAIM
jgi:hypothetical protein